MKKSILLTLFFIFSSALNAAVIETGTINNIIIEQTMVSFWVSGQDEVSECSGGARWTLNESDDLFKEKFSVLLAASTAGKTISVRSTGTCGNWDSNKVYYINL